MAPTVTRVARVVVALLGFRVLFGTLPALSTVPGWVRVMRRFRTEREEMMATDRTKGDDQAQNLNQSNTIKDPDEWTTGDEPMTGAQRSYLKTLSDEAGESFDDNLTKAEASKRIDELQQKTGRGLDREGQAGAGA